MGRFFWPTLGLIGMAYFGLAAVMPPLDDELYYWCWAQNLQPSYFDHPPMTAYLIRASTSLLGDSVFAIRLPACLSTLVVAAVVGGLMRHRRLVPAVLATPLFTFGAVLITPDTPLLLFWALYLRWLVAAHRRLTPADGSEGHVPWWLWVLGGVLLGGGALGKYTMALAVPAGFVSFRLAGVPWRKWLPGYVGHGIAAAVLFAPVLAYNVARDFEPIRFQWAHAMAAAGPKAPAWQTAGGFAAVQVVLFGTWPFTLFPWALRRAKELSADPVLRVGLCLYAVPFGFFVLKSWRGPVEGNWALVSYLGFWPVAARWLAGCPERWRRPAVLAGFAVPALTVAGAAVHLVHPIEAYPPRTDRITRQGVRINVARRAAETIKDQGGGSVYTPTYQWVALLRFHGVDARQMAGVSRPSHFTAVPDHLSDVTDALVWNETSLPPGLCLGFGPPVEIAAFPIVVRGERASGFYLYRYRRVAPELDPTP